MLVIANPELYEIDEMLEWIGKSHDLNKIFGRGTEKESRAEILKKSWCYLWYDDNSLEPIGATVFTFHGDKYIPYFSFGTTEFCKPHHILVMFKAMNNVARNEFKNRVCVYIVNERVCSVAKRFGFRQSTKDKNVYKKEGFYGLRR